MRKFLITMAIGAAAALSASAASATVFTLSGYSIDANTSGSGLTVVTDDILATPFTVDLGFPHPNPSTPVDFFKIYTTETTVNPSDDTTADPITVTLDFSAPAVGSAQVGGETVGVLTLHGLVQNGNVSWGPAGDFTWGNGGSMLISLTNKNGTGNFDPGLFGLHGGERAGDTVQLSFDWKSDPTAVPEPASWALMIGGFGLAGATLRRRRAAAATA